MLKKVSAKANFDKSRSEFAKMAEASPAGERITGIGQLVRPGLLDSKWFKSGGKGLKLYMVDELGKHLAF